MNIKDTLTISLILIGGLILGKQIAILLKKQGVEIVA